MALIALRQLLVLPGMRVKLKLSLWLKRLNVIDDFNGFDSGVVRLLGYLYFREDLNLRLE